MPRLTRTLAAHRRVNRLHPTRTPAAAAVATTGAIGDYRLGHGFISAARKHLRNNPVFRLQFLPLSGEIITMRRSLWLTLSHVLAILAGGLVVSLLRPPPPAEKQPASTAAVVIQVPPGEAWASAWDVQNSVNISPVSGIEPGEQYLVNDHAVTQHAVILAHGNRISGIIRSDGQCHVYRRDEQGRVTMILLCKPKS